MQYEQLNQFWQKMLIIIIPLLTLVIIFPFFMDNNPDLIQLLYWLHLPLLMIHEFEEYVFPGGFKKFFNEQTVFALDPHQKDIPLNEAMIFWINIGIWVLIIVGALIVDIAPWFGLIFIIFNGIFNGFGHIVLFQLKEKGYNPGLLSTIILLVPFTYFVIQEVQNSNIMVSGEWIVAIIGGLVVGILLPVSARIRITKYNKRN